MNLSHKKISYRGPSCTIHKIISVFCLGLLLFCSILLFPVPSTSIKAAEDVTHVYDNAGILSSGEISTLEKMAAEYGAKQKLNYLIVTTDTIDGLEPSASEDIRRAATEGFSETFYSDFVTKYGTGQADCAIFTIYYPDVDGSNFADISGQGKIKEKLDSGRAKKVFDKVSSDLSNKEFLGACTTYIKTVDRYIKVRSGVDPDLFLLKLPFQLLIAFIIGAVAVFFMVHNSGGKITVTQNTYLDPKSPGVIGRYDRFIRTTTTKRKIETSSSSGSSGGGSSSGGSHGGGSF